MTDSPGFWVTGLDLLEQFRSRQQVEERIRIAIARMALNAPVLLCKRKRVRMHSGWLLG